MVLEELKGGKFFVEEGIVYSMTPITKVDLIEKELTKEIEAKIIKNTLKESIFKMLGSASEYFTENGWKIIFISQESPNIELIIAAPFKGGIMDGEISDNEKKEKIEIYIPGGYLGMRLTIGPFLAVSSRQVLLFPKLAKTNFKENIDNYKLYLNVHPHIVSSGYLCNGLPELKKFDLNMVVAQIESCIKGTGDKNSILDYNARSPATRIEDCKKAITTLKLHKQGKSDEEIWKKILDGSDINE